MKHHKIFNFEMRGPVPTRPARQVPEPQREDPQTDPDEDRPHRLPKRRKAEEFEIVMQQCTTMINECKES